MSRYEADNAKGDEKAPSLFGGRFRGYLVFDTGSVQCGDLPTSLINSQERLPLPLAHCHQLCRDVQPLLCHREKCLLGAGQSLSKGKNIASDQLLDPSQVSFTGLAGCRLRQRRNLPSRPSGEDARGLLGPGHHGQGGRHAEKELQTERAA